MSSRENIVTIDGEQYEIVEDSGDRSTVVLSVVLVLLFLLLAFLMYFVIRLSNPVGAPDAAELPDGLTWIRSIYGFGSSAEEQLMRPRDTAIAGNGDIWVSEGQNSRLVRFDGDGGLVGTVLVERGAEAGQALTMQGIDVGPDGSLFVCDQQGDKVLHFTEEGTFLDEWPVPGAADVAVSDDLIVVSSANGIALFSEEAELLEILGSSRGSDDDQFDLPRGVAISDDGEIYVADTQNRRIKCYTQAGELLWISDGAHKDVSEGDDGEMRSVDASSTEEGDIHTFQLPISVGVDGAGRLVVADAFDFSLWVIDPTAEGELVAHYGSFGQEDGHFIYPSSASYDPGRDWFAVADTNVDRIQIVRISDSGDSATAMLLRATDGSWWICSVPLGLLVLALVLLLSTRRRRADNRE